MDVEILGWPDDAVTLDLDHREFSYAGKFVMSRTGKAVVTNDGDYLAAASFSEDRTDADAMWIRYITVRRDLRGGGIGSRLAAGLRHRFERAGYGTVRIAVNNPYAFEAMSRAGFGFTGETTGLSALRLSSTVPPEKRYQVALSRFDGRTDLEAAERAFLERRRKQGPPTALEPPVEWTDVSVSP